MSWVLCISCRLRNVTLTGAGGTLDSPALPACLALTPQYPDPNPGLGTMHNTLRLYYAYSINNLS